MERNSKKVAGAAGLEPGTIPMFMRVKHMHPPK